MLNRNTSDWLSSSLINGFAKMLINLVKCSKCLVISVAKTISITL